MWLRRGQPRHWLKPQALHPERTLVDAAYVAWAKRKGYRVNVWTVNEPQEMESLIAMRVDGIITDRPALLARLLS
jgi:glycerophosphoryl diester phosphodiesterase